MHGLLDFFFIPVHPDAMPDYQDVNCDDPNCVVLGDATDEFTYQRLNDAFRLLVDLQDKGLVDLQDKVRGSGSLISLGKG